MLLKTDSEILILDLLQKAFPDSSKTTLRSMIEEGRVFIEGKRVKNQKLLVQAGQEMEVKSKLRRLQGNIQILYQDDDFVVIIKPYGLLSVSTDFEKEQTAHALLKKQLYPRTVHVVHRLDQETSGVMVFAFSERGVDMLKDLFERHDITRKYLAVVEGEMRQEKGTWRSYLAEDKGYRVYTTQDTSKGELAITHFEVERIRNGYSWLKVQLETGKKNQIRVHCKDAAHPVVGDKKYGAKTNPKNRLLLHAYFLGFKHPITGKEMAFEAHVPKYFYML